MLPRLYLQKENPNYYQSNGIGFIKYCKKCEVTEELNGEYTLNMIVHPYDKLANEIKINRFIKAKPNSRDKPQLFEITRHIVKANGEIEISGQHIKYLGLQNCTFSSKNFSDTYNGTPQKVADYIFENLYFDNNFTFYSDISKTIDFKTADIASKKLGDILGGSDYSFISEFGGEFYYDNFTIKFLNKRGTDRNYKLMFGKNLSDYNQTISNDTCYTHIVAYAKVDKNDGDGTVIVCGDPWLTNQNQSYPKVKFIDKTEDLKNHFGSKWAVNPTTGLNMSDTQSQLSYYAYEHFKNEYKSRVSEEINVTVTHNLELEEMKNLSLGDTIKICYGEDKQSLSARIIKTVYDSLAEKYISIEVGSPKVNLISFIKNKRR